MKRALFFLCGLCWIAFGVAAGILGCRFVFAGGDQPSLFFPIFAPVSAGSVLLGMAHLLGFLALSAVCIAIGVTLCSHFRRPKKR